MNKNDTVTLEITGLTSEGAGVARCGGMAVFVPFSAVGDRAECRILKVAKNYAYAKIERLLTPSPDRAEPLCPVYTKCGGCCFRHITYSAELRAKEQIVKDAIQRLGGLDIPLEPIISAGQTDGYRNKAQLPVSDSENGPVCGFYSQRSHRVVPCESCRLSSEIFSEISAAIMKYQRSKGLSCYDEASGKGLLRHIYLREGHYSGEIMVCLVVTKPTGAYNELAAELPTRFPKVKTVLLNINPDKTNVILGKREIVLFGSGKIRDIMCGIAVELSAQSFYQVNTEAAEAVYRKAAEYADLKGGETLIDLYCGAGTVGLSMSSGIKRLIGVESVPEAIENAKENASRNGIRNAEFIAADASEAAEMLAERGERPDVVVVDPPRKGCDRRALDAIIRMSPSRIVMISCNPATAARDIKYLCERGYIAEKACPADMFPRTNHVETVVLLSREFQKSREHIYLDYEPSKDIEFPTSATYTEIKAWIQEEYGLKVSSLYVAQIKQKHGIIERECYNKPKSENAKVPQCPPEKEAAIEAALRHFKMI